MYFLVGRKYSTVRKTDGGEPVLEIGSDAADCPGEYG